MLAETLVELKRVNDKSESYAPEGADADYLAELRRQWLTDLWQTRREYRYFNDKNLISYMDMWERDSFLYVPPRKFDSWRSRTRRQTPREKVNAIIAAIIDQNLTPEIFAHDIHGRDMREAADVQQSLIAYSDDVEQADEKRKMRAFELLKHGTVANEVSWAKVMRNEKLISKEFDPTKGTMKWDTKLVVDRECIWTKLVPLNRVMLGDVTKYFIDEQPHIWKEYVMLYEEAYVLFHDWKNWCFVKPSSAYTDSWNDDEMQVDTEDQEGGQRKYVRMRVYENRWTDEYAIVLNDVLMTPVGMPLPRKDKRYSVSWTQLEMFASQFAYGRSFFHVVHNDSVMLDFLYNAMFDKARQGLEPPIVTQFKNLVNKNMFAPGKVSQGDIQFRSLVNHQGITTADVEIARFVEESINKSSVSPIFQGQGQVGGQTAYEIREQQKSALRVLGLTLYSIARMEADIAELKSSLIWEHYPKMKDSIVDSKARKVVEKAKTFVVRGPQVEASGVGRKDIEFGEMPTERDEIIGRMRSMMREEDKERKHGESVKKFLVDPVTLQSFKYVFKIVVNPSQRKSKLADTAEAREKYGLYIANPLIDPEWATRLLLRANGDDEEKAIRKQQPQPEQGAPVVPGSAPSAPPEEGTGRMAQTAGKIEELAAAAGAQQ